MGTAIIILHRSDTLGHYCAMTLTKLPRQTGAEHSDAMSCAEFFSFTDRLYASLSSVIL